MVKPAYSDAEFLARRDEISLSPAELAEIQAVIRQLERARSDN